MRVIHRMTTIVCSIHRFVCYDISTSNRVCI